MAANDEVSSSFHIGRNLLIHDSCRGNVIISPYSAYSALAMTTNGASGQTRQDMARTLGFDGQKLVQINQRNLKLMNSLNSQSGKVKLEISNAIFADRDFPFRDSFKATCGEFYQAEAQSLDFRTSKALETINAWCKERTHGKIERIISKLTPDEKLVLLNTVYFKAKWATPFKKEATRPEPFLAGLENPGTQNVDTMRAVQHLAHFKTDKFQAVEMPYSDRKQSLYVFLPAENLDVNSMLAEFTDSNWKSWLSSFSIQNIELSMPKVKIEFSSELSDTLKKIGMASAFSTHADFSQMLAPPKSANISKVIQKTYLDIDEEGTEAAAATAVVMEARAMMKRPEPRIVFKVDRPFVIAIVDHDSQEVLFLGRVSDPQPK